MNSSEYARSIEREKKWVQAHEQLEADRELRRARIRLFMQRVRHAVGLGSPARDPESMASGGNPFLVPIDSVVGFVDDKTGRSVRLTLAGSGVSNLWRRVFFRDDQSSYVPLKIKGGADGWYLTDGTIALVQMEVLRAKGHRTVMVAANIERRAISRASCSDCEDLIDRRDTTQSAVFG